MSPLQGGRKISLYCSERMYGRIDRIDYLGFD